LVALAPDIVLADNTISVAALQHVTRTLPIVFAGVADPVGAGFVDSLSRPGGNITGFMVFEYGFTGKWLELLKQIAPQVTRAVVLRDPANPAGTGTFGAIQAVAPSLGVEVTPIGVDGIERAMEAFARSANGGLIVAGPATPPAVSAFPERVVGSADGLAIHERLAATDRSNTQWQRGLSILYDNVGDVLKAQGKLDDALKAYRDSLSIRERLAAADRSNMQSQRDLSISYSKVGDVLAAQGKLDEALKAYRDSLTTRERLAAADPTNMQWQRDLALSYSKLAWVHLKLDEASEALSELSKGREIMARLVVLAPSNAQWKKDLAWLDGQITRLEGQTQEAGRNRAP
jgi:hypothetical protein